jgi:hypothetical protein
MQGMHYTTTPSPFPGRQLTLHTHVDSPFRRPRQEPSASHLIPKIRSSHFTKENSTLSTKRQHPMDDGAFEVAVGNRSVVNEVEEQPETRIRVIGLVVTPTASPG